GLAHQRHFGELAAVEAAGRGGEGVDPEVGLAGLRGEADGRGAVERRLLVGHQRGAGDAAEMERGLVDGEDAEVDQPRGDYRAFCVDYARFIGSDGYRKVIDTPI